MSARWGNRWALTGALGVFALAMAFLAAAGDSGDYPLLIARSSSPDTGRASS
ncbi:hypothetical protein NKH77_15525 [Streptomyces sp. M19]